MAARSFNCIATQFGGKSLELRRAQFHAHIPSLCLMATQLVIHTICMLSKCAAAHSKAERGGKSLLLFNFFFFGGGWGKGGEVKVV